MGFSVKVIRKTSATLKKMTGANPYGFKKVIVGFPRGKVDTLIIDKATWNEFGTRHQHNLDGPTATHKGGIPERPFMRTAMRKNKHKYREAMKSSAAKILRAEVSVDIVLNKLGNLAKQDVQASITAWTTPGNAASTIKRKGSSHPLIDTGEMRGAVTYQVIGLGSLFRSTNNVSFDTGE